MIAEIACIPELARSITVFARWLFAFSPFKIAGPAYVPAFVIYLFHTYMHMWRWSRFIMNITAIANLAYYLPIMLVKAPFYTVNKA
jgi:hypothetical protein